MLLAGTFQGAGTGGVVDLCPGGIGLSDGAFDAPGRAGQLMVSLTGRGAHWL